MMLVPSVRREVSTNLLFLYLLRTSTAVVAPPERPAAWARGFGGVAFSKDRTEMKNDVLNGPTTAAAGAAGATSSANDPGKVFIRPFSRNCQQTSSSSSTASNGGGAALQSKNTGSSIGTLMAPPQVCIRTARREDIPAIEACNLKTLPENYPNAFYHNHLLQWPYLALVAERRPVEGANGQGVDKELSEKKIVGYVLGRVEGGSNSNNENGGAGSNPFAEDVALGLPTTVGRKTGHVSSLAVLDEYRRLGIARELMDILHVQMKFRYGVACSTLHVRCSNRGAQKLYLNSLGYHIVETVQKYYQDGADAYYMQLDFNQQAVEQQQQQQQQQKPEAVLAKSSAHRQQQQQQQPLPGITVREKEGALLTQDSHGYFQLYPSGSTGGAAAAHPTA